MTRSLIPWLLWNREGSVNISFSILDDHDFITEETDNCFSCERKNCQITSFNTHLQKDPLFQTKLQTKQTSTAHRVNPTYCSIQRNVLVFFLILKPVHIVCAQNSSHSCLRNGEMVRLNQTSWLCQTWAKWQHVLKLHCKAAYHR